MASLDGAQPWRLACELPPVEEDHRFADGQFLGRLTDRCQGGRWQSVEQVIGDGLPVPATAPGCCLIPLESPSPTLYAKPAQVGYAVPAYRKK